MYETQFRGYDPQIGRFGEIDPLADRSNFFSTYQFADDNPVSSNDPTGMYAQYQAPPSSSVENENPDFGPPSISQINREIGFDDGMSDPGDDEGAGGSGGAGGAGGAMFKGNGVYELPNGDYVDQTTAINYAMEIYGGSLTTYTGDYAKLVIAEAEDEALGMASAVSVKTVYNYSQDNGNKSFETPNYDGLTTTDYGAIADPYSYQGMSKETFVDGFNLSDMDGSTNTTESAGSNFGPTEALGYLSDGVEGEAYGYSFATGTGGDIGRIAGKVGFIVNFYNVYKGVKADGYTYGEHAREATDRACGSIIGAEAGADAGALTGAAIGVWFFGVGAAPGALIGGFFGGIIGSYYGGKAGENVYNEASQ